MKKTDFENHKDQKDDLSESYNLKISQLSETDKQKEFLKSVMTINRENSYISKTLEQHGYHILKATLADKWKYLLYKKDPVLRYVIHTHTNQKSDLIDNIINVLNEINDSWYIEDFATEKTDEDKIRAARKLINDMIIYCPCVQNYYNDPTQPLTFIDKASGKTYFNLFQNADLLVNRPDNNFDYSIIKEIIFNVCERNQEYYDWMINWLAVSYQNPEFRANICVMIMGTTGTGKSLLKGILEFIYILGRCCYSTTAKSSFNDKFNAQLIEGRFMIIADELDKVKSKEDAGGFLRAVMTEKIIAVNEKFQPQRLARNCAKLLILTNDLVPIHLVEDDRRLVVFDAQDKLRPYIDDNTLDRFAKGAEDERHPNYAENLAFRTEQILGFCSFLNKYPADIQKVINEPLMTQAKRDLISAGKSNVSGLIEDDICSLYNNLNFFTDNVLGDCFVLFSDLHNKYNQRIYDGEKKISKRKFSDILRINGYISLQNTINKYTAQRVKIPKALLEELQAEQKTRGGIINIDTSDNVPKRSNYD